jgi:soluble lytic murein transglycosylase
MQGRRYDLLPGKTWARASYLFTLAVVLPGTLATLPSSAMADSIRTSALPPATETPREADLPTIMAPIEAQHYRRIFVLQNFGRFAEADQEILGLTDKLLLGAVEAQRLLHKRYRPGYRELAAWLDQHADEPDAKEIYALALNRHRAGTPPPARPVVASISPRSVDGDGADAGARQLSAVERRQAQQLHTDIAAFAYSEPRRAELMLGSQDARHLLSPTQQDELRTRIASGYLARGKVQDALMLSATIHGPAYAAAAHWQAGLAAWRLSRYGEAGPHFQAVVRSPGQSSWTISAAAFWAARVELRNRKPERFNYWLGLAAEHPRTFYGVLARRMLGDTTPIDFDTRHFAQSDADLLADAPGGRRALALLQVDQPMRAEAELRALAPHATPALVEALAAVADRANMPALSLQLAGLLAEGDGRHHAHALYPVPRWTPLGGFTVDRALLFAVMRQESQFLTHVQSYAGAMGLMQLMPATADAMAKRTGVPLARRGSAPVRDALADPEVNLALAQEYITTLMTDERIKGNLVLLAAAYNIGPGAMQRWQPAAEFRNDPLLFIESIPVQQTRVFTERVLANYWIYRQRLGQTSPDLDALAGGRWPTYTALDSPPEPDRRHAENR